MRGGGGGATFTLKVPGRAVTNGLNEDFLNSQVATEMSG